jgi:hypothetical protein
MDTDAPECSEDTEARVEDMTLEEKLKVLKKYNPMDKYYEGAFIDSQDTVTNWCLAQVIAIDGKDLNIHFDGWPHKWDEVST